MRDEAGFTLVELLAAMLIGSTVLAVAVGVLTGAQRRSDDVQRRTTGLYQARLGMDTVVRTLRAQSCLQTDSSPQPPIVAASANEVTIYADLNGGSTDPQRRTLKLDPVADKLTETVWDNPDGTGTSRTRTVASNVEPVGSTPVFQFFAFDASSPPVAVTPLAAPLSATARTTVARIVVTLRALPPGTQDGARITTLQDEVFTRLADPDGAAVPQCI